MESHRIFEPSRETPVIAECDVLVVGGGPAGVSAAVAAARSGAEVILLEKENYLGGLATGGTVLFWPGFTREGSYAFGGLPLEIVRRMDSSGAIYYGKNKRTGYVTFDCELLRLVMQQMLTENKVRLIFHVYAVGVIMSDSSIKALLIESKAGRQAIQAKVFVDCTGDGDLIEFSGAAFERGSMPVSFTWNFGGINMDAHRIVREYEDFSVWKAECVGFHKQFQDVCKKLGFRADNPLPLPDRQSLWCNGTLFYNIDPLSPEDLTKVDTEGRARAFAILQELRRTAQGFQEAYLYQLCTLTGVRVARVLKGKRVLSKEDIDAQRQFDDCIGIGDRSYGDGYYFEIPYGCLTPYEIKNLLAAGRCISVTPPKGEMSGAHDEIREIPHCMVTGQAAGVAAAVSSKNGQTPSEIKVSELQKTLQGQGVLLKPRHE